MFIVVAVLTGGAVGFAAGRTMKRADRDPRAELARELHLTGAQQQHFDSVFAWRRATSRRIMATVQPALDSVRDSSRTLMLGALDAAQQTAFRALIERNRRSADSGRSRGGR